MSNLKACNLGLLSKQILREGFLTFDLEMISFSPPPGFMLPLKVDGNIYGGKQKGVCSIQSLLRPHTEKAEPKAQTPLLKLSPQQVL